ncbi:MAG TPA: hypothetical protein VJ884_01310, partial [Salinibacter sp.]|nr:hypothetical protein [Salinibacter sp.]
MMGGWFTRHALGDYVSGRRVDYVGARRVVNGTDKAKQIAKIAVAYEEALTRPLGSGTMSPGATAATGVAAALAALAGAVAVFWDKIKGVF